MPAKLKVKKADERGSELRLLEAAGKDVADLFILRDILQEIVDLVSRHNRLAGETRGSRAERPRAKRSEIISLAKSLKTKLDIYAGGRTLAQLQEHSENLYIKHELNRLLHIKSALLSEYKEILSTVGRHPHVILTMSSSELDYFAGAIVKMQHLIHKRIQSVNAG